MANARDIRRRIKSVKNIQQITKAMKMVAAARLRRAQERAIASRPYTDKIREVLASVTANAGDASHPLLEVREVKQVGYLVLSADKGLAGAYSSNLVKEVLPQISGKDNARLVTVGRKARDYFKRRGYKIDGEYFGFSEKPSYQDAVMLAELMAEKFASGEYDEIYLTYTHFYSPVNQKPTTVKLLPVTGTGDGEETPQTEYIFEPSAGEVLSLLLPRYLETVIYGALLQSSASELGSRMTAMGSATDNAQELISKLTLNYNKVRQATITSEINEIVGGAEALK
ncbi:MULTISPECIES: ATP synthase F1 subunit gamma [Sporomusa]|jgi:F-type H+-transporting ATPase subunit gamma|uniref:ATP synthase F1 subunit gamma n=1 Tax=Sporomusa TaxID=2375 RepID=UPI00166EF18B|nr:MULTISPECIES: ATP synthase F1 subunit gamma [Sporomusa]MCM0757945.1 ATP synthase F1 subunit gamma [Sporomusa sphaeroides DSM 2875]HML34074.1 ATP synthase F1 subunit gamma [Sporomusa sphaeroides]